MKTHEQILPVVVKVTFLALLLNFGIAHTNRLSAQMTPLNAEGSLTIPKGNMQVGALFGEGFAADPDGMITRSLLYGIKVGYGISDQFDLKLLWTGNNYSFKFYDEWSKWNLYRENSICFSPKFSFLKGHLAAKLPVTIIFGNTEFSDKTVTFWLLSPRFVGSIFYKEILELSFSPYMDIYLPHDDIKAFYYLGANLGIALSTNLKKWSVRPEGYFAIPLNETELTDLTNRKIFGFGLTAVVNFEVFK